MLFRRTNSKRKRLGFSTTDSRSTSCHDSVSDAFSPHHQAGDKLVDAILPSAGTSGFIRSMKPAIAHTACFAYTHLAYGRLTDTEQQLTARYGLPKKLAAASLHPLVEGAKELTFKYQDWRIRCALLTFIQDFERDAILEAEGGAGAWKAVTMGPLSANPEKTIQNLFLHTISGKHWVRQDGATATVPTGALQLLHELPQARKYEAEYKAIKQERLKSKVPSF